MQKFWCFFLESFNEYTSTVFLRSSFQLKVMIKCVQHVMMHSSRHKIKLKVFLSCRLSSYSSIQNKPTTTTTTRNHYNNMMIYGFHCPIQCRKIRYDETTKHIRSLYSLLRNRIIITTNDRQAAVGEGMYVLWIAKVLTNAFLKFSSNLIFFLVLILKPVWVSKIHYTWWFFV